MTDDLHEAQSKADTALVEIATVITNHRREPDLLILISAKLHDTINDIQHIEKKRAGEI